MNQTPGAKWTTMVMNTIIRFSDVILVMATAAPQQQCHLQMRSS